MPVSLLASAPDSLLRTSPQPAAITGSDSPVTEKIASAENSANDMTVAQYNPVVSREDRQAGNLAIRIAPDNREANVLLREGAELYRMALDWMNSLTERMPSLVDICVAMVSFLVFSYGLFCIYAVSRGRNYTDHELFGDNFFLSEQSPGMKFITHASNQKPLSSDTQLATTNGPYRKHEVCLVENSPQYGVKQKNDK